MTRNFNLPAGVTASDIDGSPMPTCSKCGEEHNDWKNNGLCDDCQPVEDDDEAMADWRKNNPFPKGRW